MKTPDEVMDAYTKRLGAKIRQRRVMLNKSLEDIAGATGVSFQTVAKYENGQICPETARLNLLADALGCNIVDLLPGKNAATDLPLSEDAIHVARMIDQMKVKNYRETARYIVGKVAQLEKEEAR